MNNNLIGNIGHIATAFVAIAAAVVLALHGNISGESALVVIAAAAGVSLGGSIASSPGSTPGTFATSSTTTATPDTTAPIDTTTTAPPVGGSL